MQPWFTVYFFDIGHQCYDQLTPVKLVNANPGLNVNLILLFSPIQVSFCCLFCVYGDYQNSKQKAKQYTENLTATELPISN